MILPIVRRQAAQAAESIKVRINVTQEIIDTSARCAAEACAVAEALLQAGAEVAVVAARYATVRVGVRLYTSVLPNYLSEWIRASGHSPPRFDSRSNEQARHTDE